MGGGGGGSAQPPPVPPPPPAPATQANPLVTQAGAIQKQAAAARVGGGFDNTIATSPQGTAPATTIKQKLGD